MKIKDIIYEADSSSWYDKFRSARYKYKELTNREPVVPLSSLAADSAARQQYSETVKKAYELLKSGKTAAETVNALVTAGLDKTAAENITKSIVTGMTSTSSVPAPSPPPAPSTGLPPGVTVLSSSPVVLQVGKQRFELDDADTWHPLNRPTIGVSAGQAAILNKYLSLL